MIVRRLRQLPPLGRAANVPDLQQERLHRVFSAALKNLRSSRSAALAEA
jgi:hypothetical protein